MMYLFFVPKRALFIIPLVLIHPNKMELLKENITTFWMLLEP